MEFSLKGRYAIDRDAKQRRQSKLSLYISWVIITLFCVAVMAVAGKTFIEALDKWAFGLCG